ncbi:MAG: RNA polymerase sigma factor [Acidimicrobiia bacterium]
MTSATMIHDYDITEAIAEDLDTGFIDLVRTHQTGIYSGSRRLLRSHHDAEDVAQDTFVRAYKALENYDEDRIRALKLRGWLWTIALNLCRNRWTAPPGSLPLFDNELVHNETEPIDDDAWNARLAKLSDDQRTAVVLRHVVDLSIVEISEATGRPGGTVKADISRGLSRLRTTMEGEDLR